MSDVRVIARDRRDILGEGLLWSTREQAVFWVDILGKRVNRLSLTNDAVTSWELPEVIGWLIERESGGFVAGLGRAFVFLTLDPFRIVTIAAPEPERHGNRFNDAKADAKGRIWAGSMPVACDKPTGALYRLDLNGQAARVDDGYIIPNGPAIADGFLLHTDSTRRTIYRHAVHDDGSLGPSTPFVEFEDGWGNPDGMCFDAEGHLWVACWRGACVMRFDPQGRHERSLPLPTPQVTNVAFAGDGFERMFVTSEGQGDDGPYSGCLFELDPGCRGTAPYMYAG